MRAVLLGLLAAVLIGYVDHLGANHGRRGPLLTFVFWIYVFTLLSVMVLSFLFGGEPTAADLALGGLSGISASVALTQLYKGYTTRGVGIVGPVAAVTGAVIPVVLGAVVDGLPSAVTSGGILAGVAAIWLIGLRNPSGEWDTAALRYGLISGVLFGVTATLLGFTSSASGIWPAAPGRLAAVGSVFLMVLKSGQPRKPPKGQIRIAGVIGLGGGAGLGAFTLAIQDNLAVGGLLFQMSYGFTLLFQILFSGERASRTQTAGFGLAAAALAMIILG